MNILKKVLIGVLAAAIPVGGTIYLVANNGSSDDKNNAEVENKEKDKDSDKDKDNTEVDPTKKNDNEKHPGTDAIEDNEHSEKIESLRKSYNNDEIVGYISIPNTQVSSIVVQHNDNEYYLTHSATKTENTEGAIYLDYRTDINSGRKNIIYGHNGNSENLNVPFSDLEKYYDKAFLDQNQYI